MSVPANAIIPPYSVDMRDDPASDTFDLPFGQVRTRRAILRIGFACHQADERGTLCTKRGNCPVPWQALLTKAVTIAGGSAGYDTFTDGLQRLYIS